MGIKFTLSTVFAVTVLTLFTGADHWLPPVSVSPLAGAICGGALIGFGLSLMFYHQASLGGANILALFLQSAADGIRVPLISSSILASCWPAFFPSDC